jgi:hypothetical protein
VGGGPLVLRALLVCCTSPGLGDGDCVEIGGMKIGRWIRSTLRKRPRATLSSTNPTWLDPGLNPGRRSGKPATNRLCYGAADGQQKYVFVSSLESTSALGLTLPPNQGSFLGRGKVAEAWSWGSSNVEDKNGRAIPAFPHVFMTRCLIKHKGSFTFLACFA